MITVCVTSCNRWELLEQTLDSFLNLNTYPIERYLLHEDSDNVDIVNKIKEKFDIAESDRQVSPDKKGTFGMYLGGKWYKLTAHKDIMSDDPVDGLDVAVLQDNLLAPVLGIGDPKTDKRIDFVGGIRGLSELEKRCREDCVVAFSMYATSIAELFAVADAGKLMPPKSTWFEPKLRSGLFIHRI